MRGKYTEICRCVVILILEDISQTHHNKLHKISMHWCVKRGPMMNRFCASRLTQSLVYENILIPVEVVIYFRLFNINLVISNRFLWVRKQGNFSLYQIKQKGFLKSSFSWTHLIDNKVIHSLILFSPLYFWGFWFNVLGKYFHYKMAQSVWNKVRSLCVQRY